MPLFRWILLLLVVAGLVCLAMYVATGERRWLARGTRIIKWAVVAGLLFFAVLIAERVAELF